MKLFLDSADKLEVFEMDPFIDGVTTNPSLLKSFDDVKAICDLMGKRPVSVEVTEMQEWKMFKQGFKLGNKEKNIVVKLPCTQTGIKVCRMLSQYDIKTNVTLVFSPVQAYLAMKAGATYISPFLGRLRDSFVLQGEDSNRAEGETWFKFDVMKSLKESHGFDTEILIASIRTLDDVLHTAYRGFDVATVPYKIMKEMFNHDLTTAGIKKFEEDWNASHPKT